MEPITYCLMCLETNVRMYQMTAVMKTLYNEMLSTSHKRNMNQMYACYECAYLLQKYEKFKIKCRKAYNILHSLSSGALQVTEECLNSIDRKKFELVSLMTSITFCTDYQPNQDEYESDKYNIEKVESDSNTFDNEVTNDEDDPLQGLQLDVKKTLECNTVIKYDCQPLDVKTGSEQDVEDDYQFTQTFQVDSSNSKLDTGSMSCLTIQSKENTEVCDNETLQNPVHIDQECLDPVHHDYLDDYLVEQNLNSNIEPETNVDIKINKRKRMKKQKLEKKTDNNADEKKIMKNLIKNTESRGYDVSDTDINGFLTLDSKIFNDHMIVIDLTPDDAQREFLLRKKSSNYTTNPFKCDLCYRGFLSKTSYESHLKKHSLKNGDFQCDICKLRFIGKSYLYQHWVRMHRRKFSCRLCPYTCFAQTQCTAHILSHRGMKYTCKKCGMAYRYRNSLLTHMHVKHSVECVCEFCGSTFASENGLLSHKNLIHRQEENEHLGPRCDECDVHFASELAWKRHRVLCSRHQVQFGCKVCGDVFEDSGSLRAHSRKHEPKVYKTRRQNLAKRCQFCKIRLPDKTALKNHLMTVHPNEVTENLDKPNKDRSYVCEFCGKAFSHFSHLVYHQKVHSDEMPYSCSDCGMRTKYKESLDVHRRTHTEEYVDKFQCDLCGRAFSDKCRLVRHMKGHMGIFPYKCVACDKSFMFRCYQRNHYKYVHDKEPYPKKNESKRTRKKVPHARIKIFDNIRCKSLKSFQERATRTNN